MCLHVFLILLLIAGYCSDVANKTFNAQDARTPRSFSKFLVRLTNEVPRLVLKQLSLVQTQMDSEVSARYHAGGSY